MSEHLRPDNLIDVGSGHWVEAVDPDGAGHWNTLWEHPTLPGYAKPDGEPIPVHMVSGTGCHWVVVQRSPLTLTPSLHCDPAAGGCGRHGFVTSGVYRDA